jgi:hypothetical protein
MMAGLSSQAERQIAALSARWPALDIEWVRERAILALDAGPRPLKAERAAKAAARGTLGNLADDAQKMLVRLQALSSVEFLAMGGGVGREIQELRALRDRLWQADNKLESQTRGRPIERNALLVREIAHELGRAGLPVDTTPNGPLCGIFGTIAEAVGEKIGDVPRTVRQALMAVEIKPK